MAFNDQLRKARREAKFTQLEMAKKIGVAKSTYTGYETGNGHPTIETVQKIMAILSVDANFLWNDEMSEKFSIPDEEKKLLTAYRDLDFFGKKAVLAIIEIERKRVKQEAHRERRR